MSQRIGKLTNRIVRRTGEATPKRLRRLLVGMAHKARGVVLRAYRRDLAKILGGKI